VRQSKIAQKFAGCSGKIFHCVTGQKAKGFSKKMVILQKSNGRGGGRCQRSKAAAIHLADLSHFYLQAPQGKRL